MECPIVRLYQMQSKNGYRIPISTSKHIIFNDGGHIICLHAPHVGIHKYKVKNWNKITGRQTTIR